MPRLYLFALFLILSACGSQDKPEASIEAPDKKIELTGADVVTADEEKNKSKQNNDFLKKVEIDLDFDSITDPVVLIQKDAQFSVVASIKGKDVPIFNLDYGTLEDYKKTSETYGEFSLDVIKAGSVYQDENGDDKKLTLNGIDIYSPPEQRHIFVFQNGKFTELPVFTP